MKETEILVSFHGSPATRKHRNQRIQPFIAQKPVYAGGDPSMTVSGGSVNVRSGVPDPCWSVSTGSWSIDQPVVKDSYTPYLLLW